MKTASFSLILCCSLFVNTLNAQIKIKWVFEPQFDEISYSIHVAGQVPVLKDTLWGLVSDGGKVLIPFKYKQLSPDDYATYSCQQNDKRGLFDRHGKIILPAEYRFIEILNDSMLLAHDENYPKTTYFGFNGKPWLPIKYDYVVSYAGNVYTVRRAREEIRVNRKGKILGPEELANIPPPTYDVEMLLEDDESEQFDFNLEEYPFLSKYETKYRVFKPGGFIVTQNKLEGFVRFDGTETIPPIYDHIDTKFFNGDTVLVQKNAKKKVICAANGQALCDFVDDIRKSDTPEADLLLVQINKKWGSWNKKCQVLIPAEFDNISPTYHNPAYFYVKKNGKYGLIDIHGTQIQAFDFDDFRTFPNSTLFWVKKSGKWGAFKIKP